MNTTAAFSYYQLCSGVMKIIFWDIKNAILLHGYIGPTLGPDPFRCNELYNLGRGLHENVVFHVVCVICSWKWVHRNMSIVCSKIHVFMSQIFLKYSIFMKTSGFNRCLFNEKAFQSALPQNMYLLIRAYSFI